MMQVTERVCNRKILPVTSFRNRFSEIAILHHDDVGIEQSCKFLTIIRSQSIIRPISLGHKHRRPVEAGVAHYDPLLEGAGITPARLRVSIFHIGLHVRSHLPRSFRIDRPGHFQKILLAEDGTLQLLYRRYAFN